MKTVTKYEAYTGALFDDPAKCEEFERRCRAADEVIAQLTPIPDLPSCDFANGAGYIQHDEAKFWEVRDKLLELALVEFDHPWIRQSLDNRKAHPSYVQRILSEGSNPQLDNAWYRIVCTDHVTFREYGQPYYAAHPDKAKDVELA